MALAALGRGLRVAFARLPTVCLLCGRHTGQPYSLCTGCERGLSRPDNPCLRCGTPLIRDAAQAICGACLLHPPSFDTCRAALMYEGPVRGLISRFKFDANLSAGYALSRLLARQMGSHYLATGAAPDCLLPVPLHWRRRRHRGFNQAREIARVIAEHCRIPVQEHWLRRRHNTAAQSSQPSKAARRRNLAAAFAVDTARMPIGVNSVAIIDDVVTTMATVEAMSRALRTRGVTCIEVWCLARARL